jgi:hypothetical protein
MNLSDKCIQQRLAPKNACFGCGPANSKGLQIRSFAVDDGRPDELLALWTPDSHHEAFEGVLSGGIVGALLDCHSNWAAICHLMGRDGLDRAPCCVTAEFSVKMRAPTPTDTELSVRAWRVSSEGSWVTIEATLAAGDEISATCLGKFVSVKPGHPAHHRW